ncbi:hypothetical protein K502DRAFT_322485 [Neoconidiobolus thromboides FSU 785]|nr:hypothetical protein K502DRAFT_322485 [Neoconidiobolus thromboides FSU 785]
MVTNKNSSNRIYINDFKSRYIIGALYNPSALETVLTYNGEAVYSLCYDSNDLLLSIIYPSKGPLFGHNISKSEFLY